MSGTSKKGPGNQLIIRHKKGSAKFDLGRSVPSSARYFCWNELQLLLIVLGKLLKGALLWVEM